MWMDEEHRILGSKSQRNTNLTKNQEAKRNTLSNGNSKPVKNTRKTLQKSTSNDITNQKGDNLTVIAPTTNQDTHEQNTSWISSIMDSFSQKSKQKDLEECVSEVLDDVSDKRGTLSRRHTAPVRSGNPKPIKKTRKTLQKSTSNGITNQKKGNDDNLTVIAPTTTQGSHETWISSIIDSFSLKSKQKDLEECLSEILEDDSDIIKVKPLPPYIMKIKKLRDLYKIKLSEIKQKEQKSIEEIDYIGNLPVIAASSVKTCSKEEKELKVSLLKKQIRNKFDAIRVKLKQDLTNAVTKIGVNRPSNRKHPIETVKILNKWFKLHSDYPYPTVKQKNELARKCHITVRQVSTWFNHKRNRSKNVRKGK